MEPERHDTIPPDSSQACKGAATAPRIPAGTRLRVIALASLSLLFAADPTVQESETDATIPGPPARSAPADSGTAAERRSTPSGPLVTELIARVAVGHQPKQVLFSEDGSSVFVTLLADTGIDQVAMDDLSVTRIGIPGYDHAHGFVELVHDSARNQLLVTQMTTGRVHELTRDGSLSRTLRTHGRWAKVVALHPGRPLVAVSNWLSNSVTVLDLETGELVQTITVSGAATPRGLAFTPNGERLLVAWFGSGDLTVHDTADWSLAGRLSPGGALRHVVVSGDGTRAYVSNMAARQVHVVSLEPLQFAGSMRVGSNPNTIVLSPTEDLLFVSCRGPNNPDGYELRSPRPGTIHAISTQTLEPLSVITAGTQPTGLDVSPDGSLLASSSFQDDEVLVFRIARGQ